ncbi:MAG: 50S ribosomal protein L11 methyltransferase [Ruminococcaceae bacterium]|nr:50S ribosomal protein L11 methyltransferase [Oscillospiraceae bacterium]
MDWIQIKIITTNSGLDPVCGVLYDLGITGIEISDKEDFKEFLENNKKYWDYVDEELERLKNADSCITVYFSKDEDGKKQCDLVKAAIAELKESDSSGRFGTLEILEENMKDEDWSENWKQFFKPLAIGERVLVVPEWETEIPESDRIKFLINPGLSFGTGSHESTRMCIEEIEKYVKEGDKVLDLGCGSGILSVIALLLGAKEATAVDIDPMAVEVAYSNLKLNGLTEEIYHGFDGDITTDTALREKLAETKYEIVLANIVADVIIALSAFVKDFLKEDGVFICSGIIIERKDEVVKALENAGLKVKEVRTQGEWAAAVCTL